MNQSSYTGPTFLEKTLTILAFLTVIVVLVWLAVKIVTILPGAFATLAETAEELYNERPHNSILVSSNKTIVNHTESITINWTDMKRAGTYTFSYECVPGVAVDMRFPGNAITAVPCGDVVRLGENVYSLELITRSERQRFIDIDYTVGFLTGENKTSFSEMSNTYTVVNASIPQGRTLADAADETATEPADTAEPQVAGEQITATEPTTTAAPVATTPATPAVRQPQVRTVEIFELPTSDPNGFVDLAVKYQAVGTLRNDNTFVPGGVIDNDARGAFQFEVRNLGTKTSADWTFEAVFTSGNRYDSSVQAGLKPNERSVITLGFDTVGDLGAQPFGAEITVPGDINSSNNRFSWAVNIVD